MQGRGTDKIFADSSAVHYAYENTTSRLKSVTDAMEQVTSYSYNDYNNLQQVSYSNAVHDTPPVAYTYDPNNNMVATLAIGSGTVTYRYNPVAAGTLGSGRHAGGAVTGSTSYSVNYSNPDSSPGYDELGRVVGRQIDQGNSVVAAFDSKRNIW